MTAIVGVLSRRGIAFAADSAATHTSASGQKITNHANKIFTLSKYQPVGVALYSNLDFMGIPWDNIIKMFRDDLRQKKFATLQLYIDEFWKFIKKNCLATVVRDQEGYVEVLAESYNKEIHVFALSQIGGSITQANTAQYFQHYIAKLDDFKASFSPVKAPDFKSYKFSDFQKYAKNSLDKVLAGVTAMQGCPADFRIKFEESLYSLLCHNSHTYFLFTGLVFFGYGDKELFPSYKEYLISYAVDNHIKYTPNSSYEINNLRKAVIAPFAQTDVTNTVIRAVEDDLRKKFYDNNKLSLSGFRDEIVNQMQASNAPQQLIDILNALDIDKYSGDYEKGMNDYIQNHYIDSLIETVAYLSKEDLADMAESLVRMTCIKRRITSTQETVGGPVDVAVVTKGDGFIWMKRKHYFDPKLNPQFFERYNK